MGMSNIPLSGCTYLGSPLFNLTIVFAVEIEYVCTVFIGVMVCHKNVLII